jgi:YidC/Oxa1 family membrane protein insertase
MPIFANVIEDAFSPLITIFEEIMVFIHHVIGGSWGLAIVGLTVLIRAVLVPLTYKQLKSMQEMQRLAPEMQRLKEKYKDDKQRQQQELMKFYQEKGINPLASCLPLLLQLPVFVSLFYMLRTDLKKQICGPQLVSYYNAHPKLATTYKASTPIHTFAKLPAKFVETTGCNTVAPGSAKFLFIPDITAKATGIALVVLIVMYVGSQLASTFIATATADPSQRWLFLLLPVVFVVILYRYPAGLLVYWITTNLWTIGQQSLIRRSLPPPAPPPPKANGKPTRSLRQVISEAAGGGAPVTTPPQAEVASAGGAVSSSSPPPRSPRKKKKRSGRRR